MRYLLFLILSSCALVTYDRREVQDCVSSHLKILKPSQGQVTPELYDHAVENCRAIHGGRP